MARASFTLVMLAIASGMALLLGVVGIYGVIAYSVSQRTREIGIRMALGASQESVRRMFVRNGLWLTGIGVGCGVVAGDPPAGQAGHGHRTGGRLARGVTRRNGQTALSGPAETTHHAQKNALSNRANCTKLILVRFAP